MGDGEKLLTHLNSALKVLLGLDIFPRVPKQKLNFVDQCNRPWGVHAAADQGPVCWILYFSWTSLHTILIRYSWPDVCSVTNCAKNRLRGT